MENLENNTKRHFFNPELAKLYGVDEAIMLNNLIFWITSNAMHGKNYHDGKHWTYNTASDFKKYFRYWTESQIYRILKSLKNKNIIIYGNYNRSPFDQRIWYALEDEEHFLTNYNPFDEIEECKRRY